MAGVFAGGDMVSGPSSVIESIAAGRQGAISIDKYLGGRGVMEEQIAPQEDPTLLPPLPEGRRRKTPPPYEKPVSQKATSRVHAGGARFFGSSSQGRSPEDVCRCDLETD